MSETNKKNNTKKISAIILAVVVLISFGLGYFAHFILQKTSSIGQIKDIINSTSFIIDPITGEARNFTEEDYIDAMVNGLLDKYNIFQAFSMC